MGWLQTLGDIGTVWDATSRADQTREQREMDKQTKQAALDQQKRNAEIQTMQLEDARRQNESRGIVRNAMSKMGTLPDLPQYEQPVPQPVAFDDDGNAMPKASRTIAAVPGRPDVYGGYNEASRQLLATGDFEGADAVMKKAKLYKQEGLGELASDLAGGADPSEAVQRYNSRGIDKIDPQTVKFENGVLLGNRANGKPFSLDPRRVLTDLGLVKSEAPLIVPEGGTAIDRSGKVLARGEDRSARERAKADRDFENKKKEIEYKAKIEADYGQKGTELMRNVEAISQWTGKPMSEAYAAMSRAKGRPLGDTIASLAKALAPAGGVEEKDRASYMKEITAIARQISDADGETPAPKAATGGPPAQYPGAKQGRDKQGNPGWYVVKDGKTFKVE